MKTFSAKSEEIQRNWVLVDAKAKVLGRIATHIASRLKGKHRPEYTPHVDTGDYVVVLNAAEVLVTGRKTQGKIYNHHTGYPGGIKAESFEKMLARRPEKVIELAVKGMLPKNSLGRAMFRKLKVYAGSLHPHTAQQPEILEI